MATTTATITLATADMADNSFSVSNTSTLYTAGTDTGGDWMFIPWCAASGKDIEFTASDATETTLEYTCFYE